MSEVLAQDGPPWLPSGFRQAGPRLASGPVTDVWPAIEVITRSLRQVHRDQADRAADDAKPHRPELGTTATTGPSQ